MFVNSMDIDNIPDVKNAIILSGNMKGDDTFLKLVFSPIEFMAGLYVGAYIGISRPIVSPLEFLVHPERIAEEGKDTKAREWDKFIMQSYSAAGKTGYVAGNVLGITIDALIIYYMLR